MPSTPSKGSRSRWGMARFELETNYDKVKSIVASTPNYTVAHDQLVASETITITYAAFVRTWKKLQSERVEDPAVSAGNTAEDFSPQDENKARKPLPELNKFTVPTGSDGVRDQW